MLFAGGIGYDGYLKSVQVYDASTNSWTSTAILLKEPKSDFAGASAGNKVLLGGGYNGAVLSSVDIFQLK